MAKRAASKGAKAPTIRVDVRRVDDLKPYPNNARTHPREQIEALAALIEEVGWTVPILADDIGIVAGHGRQDAARLIYSRGGIIRWMDGSELPTGTVPVIDCTGWTEAQRRAYIIADNRIAETSEWDEDLLKLELHFLEEAGFDLALTGFDDDALDGLLREADPSAPKASLSDRFGVPPFSVLNARDGWWQDRKRAWLALGIRSELGRGENLASMSGAIDRREAIKGRAEPGGSKMPAANYSKNRARGDGRGRAVK